MSPLELLRRFYVAGVDVTLNAEGGIRIRGNPPPPELIDVLRAHRDDVVRVLEENSIGDNADGFPSNVPRRYVVPVACLGPAVCSRLGPCSRYLMTRPCSTKIEPQIGGGPGKGTADEP